MPDLRDISIGSRYTGDSGIGGGGFGVLQIDTRPLQQLAQYTFEYNRTAFLQRQKDFEEKAKELADLTSYDLTTAIPEDRKKIQKGYDELYTYVQQNPNVLDYKNNPKGFMEYKKMVNDFENKLSGAKVRSIGYLARDKEVSETKNAGLKALYKKNLDDEAKSTDLDTPLKHTQQWEIAPVAIKPPDVTEFDVSIAGSDLLGTRTWKLPDMDSVEAQAVRIKLGLDIVDTESDDFKKKPQKEKDLIMAERDAQVASGRLEPVKSAEAISTILRNEKYQKPEFRNADGSLNIEAVKADNSGNGLVTGFLSTMQQYNAKMDEMTKAIDAGYFQDKLGKQLSFGIGGLNRDKYRKIDLKDGVSPEEILKPRILGLAKPEEFTTKITERDLKRENLALDWFKARSERMRATADSGKPIPVLDKPADFIDRHVRTLKTLFKKTGGKNVTIEYGNVDAKTRLAIGLKAGETVTFWNDGDFIIHTPAGTDDDGTTTDKQTRRKGTIENVVQGFIEAVKTTDLTGEDKDGTMAQGFQQNSEARLRQRWGSSSGKDIWNSPQWDNPDAVSDESESKSKTYKIGNTIITESQIEKGAAKYKMSVEEYKRSIGL